MKTFVKESKTLICNNCGEEVYMCDECGNYFLIDDCIFCQLEVINGNKNKHFCKPCSKEDWES